MTFRARRAVDGLLAGIHRSPHRGASVVFVEHRDYRPGDDLRLLDWRAYARTDRDVVKRFEQETQLRAVLVLDRSGSMAYKGEGRPSKADHAATLLAAFGYVLVGQGDATGVVTLDEELRHVLPPRTRPAQLDAVLAALCRGPERGRGTRLGPSLSAVAEHAGRRGVVAVASDLLDFDEHALRPLAHLVARGHDVIVFHVLDPDELTLPMTGPTRFVGLEGEPDVEADPDAVRASYGEQIDAFLASCERRCIAAGARYALARTDQAPERVLGAAILTGGGRRRWV